MQIRTRFNTDKPLGGRILKVNHAGEHGAVSIYTGQILIARWTAPSAVQELIEFRAHEQQHRAIFQAELARRDLARCQSYHLCAVGGFVLGCISALFGRPAIAATTVAVEQVVLRHLQQQLTALVDSDPAAAAAISQIIADEQLHHDQSALHLNTGKQWPRIVTPIVAASTESVIWLGMHL